MHTLWILEGKDISSKKQNYVQIEEVGIIGTKEMGGPDKNRRNEQS